ADAERIAEDPSALDRLDDDAPDDMRAAHTGLVVRLVLLALAGGVVRGLAARTDWQSAAGETGVSLHAVGSGDGGTVSTFDVGAIAEGPSALDRLGGDAPDDVRAALTGLVVRCVLLALAGGVVGGLAARTDWRSAAGGVGVALLLVVAVGGGTVATFDAGAVA